MLNSTPTPIDARMDALERHLKNENPELLDVVKSYRELDKVAHSVGMLPASESLATGSRGGQWFQCSARFLLGNPRLSITTSGLSSRRVATKRWTTSSL